LSRVKVAQGIPLSNNYQYAKFALLYVRKYTIISDMKNSENTTQLIRQQINTIPLGKPFTTATFLALGKRTAIDKAISRLVKAGEITRVSRGIFVRPEQSRYLGAVLPNPTEIAKLVAETTGSIIQVHGAAAINRLSLSTQVPTQLIYYTTGPSRQLHFGKLRITLKHTSPRKLALADRAAGLAFTALWYLGKQHVTQKVIQTIQKRLPPEEFEALVAATPLMPGWMADIFFQFKEKQNHV